METLQLSLRDFPTTVRIPTRWSDNDHYGHVNNAAYYLFFDTAVNGWLIREVGVDIRNLDRIGIVAATSCRYLEPVAFPDVLQVGLATTRIGQSSVSYQLALFRERDEAFCAIAKFVHVYVDRDNRQPVPMPDEIRRVASTLPSMPELIS